MRENMYARQGDVGFVRCLIPTGAKKIPVRPLAFGEKTGHSHTVAIVDLDSVEMYELEDQTFLRVTGDHSISIVHQEHDPQGAVSVLPVGWEGTVRIAQEYDEELDFRRVAD